MLEYSEDELLSREELELEESLEKEESLEMKDSLETENSLVDDCCELKFSSADSTGSVSFEV